MPTFPRLSSGKFLSDMSLKWQKFTPQNQVEHFPIHFDDFPLEMPKENLFIDPFIGPIDR